MGCLDNDPTEEKNDEKWVVRNRFGLKYNVPKLPLKPYAQLEIYNRIFSNLAPSHYKNRFSAGVEISIGKRHDLDIGYKRDNELSKDKKIKIHSGKQSKSTHAKSHRSY